MKKMWFIDIGYGLVSNRLSHELDMFPSSFLCSEKNICIWGAHFNSV